MSNTQSNPILQRIVGAIFLLALILLVAVLLLQPSDHQINNADNGSNRPAASLPNTSKPQETPNNRPPVLVLESNTNQNDDHQAPTLPSEIEIISEDMWQQVEEKPTTIAGIEPAKPIEERPTTPKPPQIPQQKPKAEASAPATPKLELIANSEKPVAQAPINPPKSSNTATGQWYVQIGAFGNIDNAQKLVSQYQKQGYNVRILKDKNLNRVQIGPFSTQKAAEQVKAKTKTPSTNPAVIHFP